jgi:hypothetical protein
MGDAGASALWYVLGLISAFTDCFNAGDAALVVAGVLIVVLVYVVIPRLLVWSHGMALRTVREYVHGLLRSYAGRFRVRGFRETTCKYSLWMAALLWAHAFLILSAWPTWAGIGIIVLSALAVVLTMSVLGYSTRGPKGNIRRFGIFYEPSFALVSTFLMGKLPDLASRSFSKLIALLT